MLLSGQLIKIADLKYPGVGDNILYPERDIITALSRKQKNKGERRNAVKMFGKI